MKLQVMEQQNQQPVQEKTESQPSTKTSWKPRRNPFGILRGKYLAIIAAVAIFAASGILLLKTIEPPSPTPSGQQTPPTAPEPQPQREILDTSDWQTYRNAKYQFEIRYPEEFEVSVAGPTKYSPDRLNFRMIDICEGWGWPGDYSYALGQTENYSRSRVVIGGHEVLVHFYNFRSGIGYSYEYEVKKDNCTSLIFTFGSSDLYQPTAATKPTTEQKELFDKIIATLRFVEENETATWTDCIDEPEGMPVITSVSPDFGSVGTEIEIRGCSFSGFEGDLYAWIENEEGVSGIMYSWQGVSTSKLIRTTLGSSYCQTDNSYSGLPCEKWLTLTPGTYKIYVIPWSKKSNEVNFTVE